MNETKQKLLLAQAKTAELFTAIEDRGLILPGKTEKDLSGEIAALAKAVFGIERYWHKKIVRTGINTLQPFNGNPVDRAIEKDDILFIDFGPVVDGYEADFGRTFVLGSHPLKLKLKNDVENAWHDAKAWYTKQDSLTGAAFFNYIVSLARYYGWEFGNAIAGHIVGPFPHEQPADPSDLCLDIHPDNHSSILLADINGNDRHWILEIQFVDRANNIGAFFEQLLN